MSDFLPVLARARRAADAFFSLGMFVPWVISWTHADGLRHVWAISAAISFACGAGAVAAACGRYARELHPRHGIFLVSLHLGAAAALRQRCR